MWSPLKTTTAWTVAGTISYFLGHASVSTQAQPLAHISNVNYGYGFLTHGNGDKFTTGRFNTLHTVWEDGGIVKYATSTDGVMWTPAVVVSSTPGYMPTITSDSYGNLAIAFAGSNSETLGSLGPIHYAYKTWGATSWTVSEIVQSGTQPDIESRGKTIHLAWTTIERVQYASFPTDVPPAASMAFGEEIEITACAGTGFVHPSVIVVRESCDPVVKVAYLRYSDEIGSGGACAGALTEVGPRVCKRDPSLPNPWTLEYTDLVTAPSPGVEAVSLSMNAQYADGATGHAFLAWSDTSNGVSRTHLAVGRAGTWTAQQLNTEEHHVHVAAKKSGTDGRFRLAWVKKNSGWWLDFLDTGASFRAGEWLPGTSLTWTDPAPTVINSSFGGLIGRPQATYWTKCSFGNYDTVEAIAEVEGVCGTVRFMNHVTVNQPCPTITALPYFECFKYAVQMYQFKSSKSAYFEAEGFSTPEIDEKRNTAVYSVVYNKAILPMLEVTWSQFEGQEKLYVEAYEGVLKISSPNVRFRVKSLIEIELKMNSLKDLKKFGMPKMQKWDKKCFANYKKKKPLKGKKLKNCVKKDSCFVH
mmetsp:Transcript_6584/g.14214  ORF Transcript_6584/g.14214 Transcript_6584/m.14214 type:complete len:584 (-) Transcript_6584:91-1842(-)